MDNKITDLEIRLTHQEATIDEINEVLLKQHQIIESLKSQIEMLQRQLSDIGEKNIADASQETPPPHY